MLKRGFCLIVPLLIVMLVLTACDGKTPTASQSPPAVTTSKPTPSTTTATASAAAADTPAPSPTPEEPPPPPEPLGTVIAEQEVPANTAASISADGGDIKMEIPAGALTEDTAIQVRKVQAGEIPTTDSVLPLGDIYDFQPDGLVLDEPATVTWRINPASLAPLNLGPNQQPLLIGLTRDEEGNWELLENATVQQDQATGELVVTAQMSHFCTNVVVAAPVRTEITIPQIELNVGEGWNTSIIVYNDHATMPIYVQNVDFFATPRLNVADGGGDLTVEIPVGPGQSITLQQEGTNMGEAAGTGQFGSNITFSLASGDSEKGEDVDVQGWIKVGNWVHRPTFQPTPTNVPDYPTWYQQPDPTVTVTVEGINDAPTLDLGPDPTATVTIEGVNDPPVFGDTDPDGVVDPGDLSDPVPTVTVTVTGVDDAPVVGDTNPDGTVTVDDLGLDLPITADDQTPELTVTVDDGLTDPDPTVSITVDVTNDPPVFDPDATVTVAVDPVNDAPDIIPPTEPDPRWDFWNVALGGGSHLGLNTAFRQVVVANFIFHSLAGGGTSGMWPCFAADTPVLMADGSSRAICDIAAGDTVMAFDEVAVRIVTATVTDTMNGEAGYYYIINGGLEVTPPHPFRTAEGEWVRIEDLEAGDMVAGADGLLEITSIELVEAEQAIFNISVGIYHNYYVSDGSGNYYLVKEGP